MLDPDLYDEEPPGVGGNSSVGGSRSFGGTATASAGRATGRAGAPASAGAPSTPTTTQCADYCSGYAKTCAKELKGQNCQQVCQAELDGYGPKCQQLGLAAIKCLTPFFKAGGTCGAATSNGLARCGTALADFKSCETGAPTPIPPMPTPTPTPMVDPTTCPNMGNISVNSCDMVFGCAQGTYHTTCGPTFDAKATHCSCFHNESGFMGDMPLTDYSVACYLAASWCNNQGGAGTGGL